MSAQSASETPSTANSFPAESAVEIRLPGSDRTYEVRDVLRGMGLKWDPATHAWHGRLLGAQRAFLERRYGHASRVVVPIEAFERPQVAASLPTSAPETLPTHPRSPTGPRGPPRGYSRSRFESRLAFPSADEGDVEGADGLATPTRRFSLLNITSGLPDDSLEADEREEARRLRDLRGRVKAARAVVATTPGLAEMLRPTGRSRRRSTRASESTRQCTDKEFLHAVECRLIVLSARQS